MHRYVRRNPVSKNCRFCGRFMPLYWFEEGSPGIPKNFPMREGLIPIFECWSCDEVDDEPLDVEYYEWLIYKDTFDWDEIRNELPEEEYQALLAEYKEMERKFKQRPYLAIPKLL